MICCILLAALLLRSTTNIVTYQRWYVRTSSSNLEFEPRVRINLRLRASARLEELKTSRPRFEAPVEARPSPLACWGGGRSRDEAWDEGM